MFATNSHANEQSVRDTSKEIFNKKPRVPQQRYRNKYFWFIGELKKLRADLEANVQDPNSTTSEENRK